MKTVTLNMYHIHVIYRLNQAEYGIRIPVAVSQECVNTIQHVGLLLV